jgi:Putative auto-transporter adhesin, head GIN domain
MAGTGARRSSFMSPMSIAIIVVAAVLIAAIASAGLLGPMGLLGTVVGSGNLTTQEEHLADFTAVTVSSGFRFAITQSSSYEITVTVDDNLVDYIQVIKTGTTLSVGFKLGYSVQSASPKVEITMPDLSRLELSGGAKGSATGFTSSHDFTVSASGGGTVEMGGQAVGLTIEASGGSQLDLSGFHITNAHVDMSGGSQATVNLDGRLDANLSGGSHLFYVGNPTMGNINTSGGSTVTRK